MIGAGGYARILTEALRASGRQLSGFVTPMPEIASGVMEGVPRLGDDDQLREHGPEGIVLVNGVGTVGDPERRRSIFHAFREAGFAFASVVHPASTIASDAILGEGAHVLANAVLQTGVRVGMNTIVNIGAIVDHD